MKFAFAVLIAFALSCSVGEAKTFTKCELVKAMYSRGISKKLLPDWACLVQWESSYSTTATHKNTDGSTDYGIFQINNAYWCDSHYGSNLCNIPCQNLLTDDISEDIKCAKIVYSHHGFNAWYGWVDHCKGKALPDIRECF
uniref:Glycosyl hydrolases family 22 (GH22) domain-containing protein n=1 Tax=Anopheles quadriannulatus TaxID=34691 RepID=A0A1Y9J087_ANOQN